MKLKAPTAQTPFCNLPFDRMDIDAEGFVSFCPHQRPATLGNVFEKDIFEIWMSPQAEAVRTEILNGRLHSLCDRGGCPHKIGRRKPVDENSGPRPGIRPPTFLAIDLPNSHCNVGGENPGPERPACLMCERSLPNYRFQRDRWNEIYPRIQKLMPCLKGLHVQGVAEPFWKDALFVVLKSLGFENFKNQIQVSTVTNGTLLNESKIKRFLETCPNNNISFSIDAGSPETYVKLRRLDAYAAVIRNIMTAAKLRSPKSILRIQNSINTLNLHEVREMVRVAARARVDELSLNPTGGHPSGILVNKSNAAEFRKAQAAAVDEAQRWSVSLTFVRPLDMGFAPQADDSTVGGTQAKTATENEFSRPI